MTDDQLDLIVLRGEKAARIEVYFDRAGLASLIGLGS